MHYIGLFLWYLVISCAVFGTEWLIVIALIPVFGIAVAVLIDYIQRKWKERKK